MGDFASARDHVILRFNHRYVVRVEPIVLRSSRPSALPIPRCPAVMFFTFNNNKHTTRAMPRRRQGVNFHPFHIIGPLRWLDCLRRYVCSRVYFYVLNFRSVFDKWPLNTCI